MTVVLHLERWVDAPPERVFDALTRIDELRRWYSCDPATTWTFHTWDAQVDGELSVTIDGGGMRVDVAGRFAEVSRPNRLAYDWNDEFVELDMSAHEHGTRIVLTHSRIADDTQRQIRFGGWTTNLAGLVDHLAPARAAGPDTEGERS